jgi:pantothenate kinase
MVSKFAKKNNKISYRTKPEYDDSFSDYEYNTSLDYKRMQSRYKRRHKDSHKKDLIEEANYQARENHLANERAR